MTKNVCLPAAFALLFLLQACKHPLAIVGEGDIVDIGEGGFGCTLEQFQAEDAACENEVLGDYFANYQAVPKPGWRFVGWDGSCGHLSEGPYCRFDVAAFFVVYWDTQVKVPIPSLTAVFEPDTDDTPDNFSARPCHNTELYSPGTQVNASYSSYDSSGGLSETFTYEQMISADVDFEGQSTIRAQSDIETIGGSEEMSLSSTFYTLGESHIIYEHGAISETFSSSPSTVSSVHSPAVTIDFNLAYGDSYTQNWQSTISTTISGYTTERTVDVEKTTTYRGREVVTTAVGPIESCRFQVTETSGAAGGVDSIVWVGVDNGLLIKSSVDGLTIEMNSATINGTDL